MGEAPNIREVLSNISTAENDDVAFIVAAAINLYSESQRRLNRKVLFGVTDVYKLLSLISILTLVPEPEPDLKRTRSIKLSPEEEADLMTNAEERGARRV